MVRRPNRVVGVEVCPDQNSHRTVRLRRHQSDFRDAALNGDGGLYCGPPTPSLYDCERNHHEQPETTAAPGPERRRHDGQRIKVRSGKPSVAGAAVPETVALVATARWANFLAPLPLRTSPQLSRVLVRRISASLAADP
jgi:hypothetical protein